MLSLLLVLEFTRFVLPVTAPTQVQELQGLEPQAFEALWNETDLSQWSGDLSHWRVEDGVLIGQTTEPLDRTQYLYLQGEYGNFELTFSYRLIGGNSGVQYRSVRLPNDDVAGYQADMEDGPNYSGILYESAGRGIFAARGDHFEIAADGTRTDLQSLGDAGLLQQAVRNQEWNEYRIFADGNHLVHEINGVRMIDVRDADARRSRASGVLAIQLHQGPPMEIRLRKMRMRQWPSESEEIPVAQTQAEWIWGPEPASEQEHRYFVHHFELDQSAVVTGGWFSADNQFQLWIDGRPWAQGSRWSQPVAIDPGMRLQAGFHGIAVEAFNEGGPAGLLGYLEVEFESGERRTIATSAAWKSWSAAPADWPRPSSPPDGAVASLSFGTSRAHSGPWGDVLGNKQSTDETEIELPEGFTLERIYRAKPGEGSWASMTFGGNGRLYVSPEAGSVLEFQLGADLIQPPRPLPFPVHSAQGMEWAFDSLYVNVADAAERDGGLHRLHDSNGDGELDQHDHLARYGPPSEHGAHGIRLGPDDALYLVHGNYTEIPKGPDGEDILIDGPIRGGVEDVLLPRIWDPRGHAHGIFAPGATVYRTDAEGKKWQRYAAGMRNPYDLAISQSGQIFTYDADMEWDHGAPWYRSPRVLHLTSGAEYGWRAGTAKWPAYYPDSLPPVVETDLASPVGVELGEGSAFPAPYQQALFLGDWAWGRITVAHLKPDGATYTGEMETFLQGRGLTVTDLEFGPEGWLWFITGGRGTQSALYRVRYQDRSPATALRDPTEQADALAALERTARTQGGALIPGDLSENRFRQFASIQQAVLSNQAIDFVSLLPPSQQVQLLDWPVHKRIYVLRLFQLLLIRNPAQRPAFEQWLAKLSGQLPTGHTQTDRELAKLLVAAQAPHLPEALVPLMLGGDSQELQLYYGLILRLVERDWTPALRLQYFIWLQQAREFQGGASLQGFVQQIENDARDKVPVDAAAQLDVLLKQWIEANNLAAASAAGSGSLLPGQAVIPRQFVRNWKVDEAMASLSATGPKADAVRGSALFGQGLCSSCHRFAGQGGALGPDLTAVSHRFGRRDLLEAILEPQKFVSDQYANLVMPPGLMNTFSEQEIADLLAFLDAGAWPE
jgi:glucose/arabinose dehydrogenase/cytochrome c551/c552